MCGIWGFDGNPDKYNLSEVIKKADERGGHGSGFFGITEKGKHVYHVSHLRSNVDTLVDIAMDCRMGIGHSRLITGGDWEIINSQPVLSPRLALVHNGNIENHEELMKGLEYTPRTALDSEALVPLIHNDLLHGIKGAVIFVSYDKYGGVLRSYSNGLPLVKNKVKDTTYYCSKKWLVR